MGKFRKIMIFCLPVFLLLSGSSRTEKTAPLPVVDRVEITCSHAGETMERCYTGPQKVEPVLNYLRLLEDLGRTDADPERILGDVFQIRIYLSNGKRHVYWQRADRYLSRDFHAWRKIDQEQAGQLYGILRELPSDV